MIVYKIFGIICIFCTLLKLLSKYYYSSSCSDYGRYLNRRDERYYDNCYYDNRYYDNRQYNNLYHKEGPKIESSILLDVIKNKERMEANKRIARDFDFRDRAERYKD